MPGFHCYNWLKLLFKYLALPRSNQISWESSKRNALMSRSSWKTWRLIKPKGLSLRSKKGHPGLTRESRRRKTLSSMTTSPTTAFQFMADLLPSAIRASTIPITTTSFTSLILCRRIHKPIGRTMLHRRRIWVIMRWMCTLVLRRCISTKWTHILGDLSFLHPNTCIQTLTIPTNWAITIILKERPTPISLSLSPWLLNKSNNSTNRIVKSKLRVITMKFLKKKAEKMKLWEQMKSWGKR